MDAEEVVLGIVAAAGERVEGRTYLQKMAYFVGKMLGLQLAFRPHYYGPYSRLVSAETDRHVTLGFLSEERQELGHAAQTGLAFDTVLYIYELTDEGKRYVRLLQQLDPESFEGVRGVVQRIRSTGADYRQLSCAAKLDYLRTAAGGTITRGKASQEAAQLRWNLDDCDIDGAVDVLQQMGLVE